MSDTTSTKDLLPNAPLTLEEAAEICLRGIVKKSTLRTAAARGELAIERIGNRLVTTPAAVEAWREFCRDREKARISGCGPRSAGQTEPSAPTRNGSSAMDDLGLAQAAALATAMRLKGDSDNTSSRSTSRRAAAVHYLKSPSRT